jgi:hypothetical protein
MEYGSFLAHYQGRRVVTDSNNDTPSERSSAGLTNFGRQVALGLRRVNLTRDEAARLLRTSRSTLYRAMAGRAELTVAQLHALAALLEVDAMDLMATYTNTRPMDTPIGTGDPGAARLGAQHARAGDGVTLNPALSRRLPPRAYEVVLGYLQRMEAVGATPEQIDEAERLMVEGAYNKLHTRDARDRTEDELIVDIDAAWDFITSVLRREGKRP